MHGFARTIAFHLPQFHPIPENDAWWGPGFTEWRNVVQARPRFRGHYQPHLPADLGFYDLRLEETRIAQAELATEYGVDAFCFYHYWFSGRRILHRPVDDLLSSGLPSFPFCLCWANENWTRRWDGNDREILLAQNHSAEDDLAHMRWLLPVLSDSRYVRIEGKPLFLVYRASLLPEPRRTTEVWRAEAARAGLGELFLARVESFPTEHDDPTELGFDAAVEFQPDWGRLPTSFALRAVAYLARRSRLLPESDRVVNYPDVVRAMQSKEPVTWSRFPCVCPSWDNSARRQTGATILHDSTPDAYESWLRGALTHAKTRQEETPVFINAWNEWAEGCHLEPDLRFGRAYLEATRAAVDAVTPTRVRP